MKLISIAAGLAVLMQALPVMAEGKDILQSQCIACHALTKPENTGLQHIWERKGPDLYYAGSKFNKEWLVKWLQNPVPIRPGSELYTKHVKPGEKQDVIDTTTIQAHPKLSKEDAASVADVLMTMMAPEGLIEKGAFKGEKVSPVIGAMFFNKLRGCGACHMSKPGYGGQSAPELYTAGQRLQPDFIYSYIKDPQKIDPRVWMPSLGLTGPDLQRLTGYIVQLSEDGEKK